MYSPALFISEAFSTGSLRLDVAMRTGGVLPGEMVEICGDEGSGKTALSQHIVAAGKRLGKTCAWIDADLTLDGNFARRCGVNLSELYLAFPTDLSQTLDILETLATSGVFDLIVVDSLTSWLPYRAYIRESPNQSPPSEEKLISIALRRLAPLVSRRALTILFTRRLRQKGPIAYHKLAAHLARLSLKLHTSLHLILRAGGLIEQDGKIIGQHVLARLARREIAPCWHSIEFDIIYNQGIVKVGEVFDLGIALGYLLLQNGVYTFRGVELGSGREAAMQALQRHALLETLEQVIRRKLLWTTALR
jgi:recombination protein RecA